MMVVDRVQYTTRTHYKFRAPLGQAKVRIVFSGYISNPQPPIPVGFNTHPGVQLGDYVLVETKDLTTQSSSSFAMEYYFIAEEGHVMDSDWNNFDEDLTVDTLMSMSSFLVYREMIVVTAAQAKAASDPPKQAPADKGKGKSKGKGGRGKGKN
jgi:hypothetical protein